MSFVASPVVYPQPCTYCGQMAYTWCSRCCTTRYCCQEHLNNDWSRHKHSCVPINIQHRSTTVTGSVQESQHVTCGYIFWPSEGMSNVCDVKFDSTNATERPVPLLNPIFRTGAPSELVLTNGLQEIELRYPLSIWYCPLSFEQKIDRNKAVSGIVKNCEHSVWYGAIVVLKYGGRSQTAFVDVQETDLVTLSAYFMDLL
ncbi:hypothetical protein C8Q76DRAFT_620065 [Earliella scabrosa]|nr:hypothetical protein C8Q76DRAFT_620065 [Earliella scabrosa]